MVLLVEYKKGLLLKMQLYGIFGTETGFIENKQMNAFSPSLRSFWFNGFVALLVVMPLPFGSNRPWVSDLFGVVCALLLIVLCFDLYKNKELQPSGAPKKRLILSAAMIFIISFLQIHILH